MPNEHVAWSDDGVLLTLAIHHDGGTDVCFQVKASGQFRWIRRITGDWVSLSPQFLRALHSEWRTAIEQFFPESE